MSRLSLFAALGLTLTSLTACDVDKDDDMSDDIVHNDDQADDAADDDQANDDQADDDQADDDAAETDGDTDGDTDGETDGETEDDPDDDEWESGGTTPLVLSFDGSAVEMTDARASTFDINMSGGCIATDWPTAATPWLALDLDRSGSIESGRELFGSGTRLADGQRASNGFLALSELDTNGDGTISRSDERFSELVLWSDSDGDRQATFSELEGLGPRGILSIELSYDVDPRCDTRGNCEVERAAFSFIDAHGAVRNGEVVDIHLSCQ